MCVWNSDKEKASWTETINVERKFLRKIFGPSILVDSFWRIEANEELFGKLNKKKKI